MASFNKVVLLGNVGSAPEVRTVGDNKVAQFSLATSFRTGNGEQTDWHKVVVWGKSADVVERFVHSGSHILVEGRIQYRKYESGGQARYVTEIIADRVQLDDAPASKQQDTQQRQEAAPKPQYSTPANASESEDLPF